VPKEGSGQKHFSIYLFCGAGLAFVWMALFVLVGTFWSLLRPNTQTLGVIEHLYNGWVFSTWSNVLALLGGISVGINALFGLSTEKNSNLMIAGFVVTHFSIVLSNFWIGAFEFKKDPAPDLVIERIIQFGDDIRKKD